MRNLARLSNAANRLEAQKDWERMVARARAVGLDPKPYTPDASAGWRTIDRAIAKLRPLIEAEERQQ